MISLLSPQSNASDSLCQLKISDAVLSKQTICSTGGMSSLSTSKSPDECLICSDNKREILFKPCNHVAACESCGRRCKKCLICKKAIEERVLLDECLVCSDRKASVLFRPCDHVCACEVCAPLMKKCVKCRVHIEKQVLLLQCPVDNSVSVETPKVGEEDSNDIHKLQQQLQAIKEQVDTYQNDCQPLISS